METNIAPGLFALAASLVIAAVVLKPTTPPAPPLFQVIPISPNWAVRLNAVTGEMDACQVFYREADLSTHIGSCARIVDAEIKAIMENLDAKKAAADRAASPPPQ